MFCSQCGKKIEEDSRFCEFCGSSVQAKTGDRSMEAEIASKEKRKPEASSSEDTGPNRKIIPILLSVVIVAVTVGFLFLGNNDEGEELKESLAEEQTVMAEEGLEASNQEKAEEDEGIETEEDEDQKIEKEKDEDQKIEKDEDQKIEEKSETEIEEQVEPTKLSLSYDEHRALNVFFSNFAEVFLLPFEAGEIRDSELLRFGFFHNYVNNTSRMNYREFEAYLREDHLFESIDKYFGIDMTERNPDRGQIPMEYRDGYYFFPAADGETPPFAQLVEIYDLHDGTYQAIFDIYEALSFDVFSYEPKSHWSEEVKTNTRVARRMESQITIKGERFILLSYEEKE
ncbi:zinc-ribbon domain-containing protein [Tindallia californiensis]|uniref:Zinc-ribbon domain-containing protein n=1 Tax=Tindallia californiensis TaxID=159292 RepID=A0A1H3QR11_9FIRM|nr:zinc ribbon domain-containing protein [Tindallia californiensis]SDZ15438.1 zinc-ribbon domain-containing protein [Tindallia californiensis]